MSDTVRVKGLAELNRFLDQLPVKMEANVLRGAMRAGMKEVLPVAQANIHNVSGKLADGLKIGTRRRNGQVTARLRAAGEHAFIAPWLEFGTKPHVIAPNEKKALAVAGETVEKVTHPGAKPHPFLRPALDAAAGDATVAAGKYIKGRLEKVGLNVADIEVEEETE